jgi:GcrA cell cycle regulator
MFGEPKVNFPWSESNVVLLRDFVAKGLSASQIAKELGGMTHYYVSRNAVVGKIHRLGLRLEKSYEKYSRAQPRKQRQPPKTIVVKPKKVSLKEIARQIVALPEPDGPSIGFDELEPHHCRWPKEGAGMELRYCGATALDPHPYCPHHCLRAYQQ